MILNDQPFKNSTITSILVVNDMSKSLQFYLNVLGAELINEYGGTSAVLKFLNHWILLVTEGGPTADKPDISFEAIKNSDAVNHSFTIRVENCNMTYTILKNRGAKFITPPYNWRKEIRCFFKDPNGHLFEISEIPS